MDVRHLWLQEARDRGGVKTMQIKGEDNPADIMTKPKGIDETKRLTKEVRVHLRMKIEQHHDLITPRWLVIYGKRG